MHGKTFIATRAALGIAFAALCVGETQARPFRQAMTRAIDDADATSSVILDRLSVKLLGVDRPWDPHVCNGCGGIVADLPNRTARVRRR
ncbi:hypothetical protein [Methylobacterium sp. J-076]|uniref:hypothetical protein n=1 Tax=Methylobacterium sp. J-076 TaxID=2836655 RepID=UPI001FBB7118|nr:hypothetical protein [Methylobacterium sp. J-076]MCJ2015711.1 hypothetical protein [Methylobacterium sp. J-076]